MAGKAFFHIGFHKTGSTYIQNLIKKNCGSLPERYMFSVQGDAYCEALRKSFRQRGAVSAETPWKFEETRDLVAVEATLRDLDQAAGERTIVLSDETVFGYLPGAYSPFEAYHDLEERIAFIKTVYGHRDPKFFAYTREVTDWLLSVYKEAVKGHRERMDFASYIKRMKIGAGLVPMCADISQAAGPDILTFEDMSVDRGERLGVGTALLKWIGLTDAEMDVIHPVERSNEAFSDDILNVTLALNRSKLDRRTVREMVRRIQKAELG